MKVAVSPEGKPLADSEIALLKPPETAAVIVEFPVPPSATVTDVGFAASEKLGLLVTVRVTPVVSVNPPPVPVIVMV